LIQVKDNFTPADTIDAGLESRAVRRDAMAFKTILAAASGGTASDGAVELACRLARRFESYLEGFHVRIDPLAIAAMASDGFGAPLVGEWIEQIEIEAADRAKRTKAAFSGAVARHGLSLSDASPPSPASVVWREDTGYAPLLVSRRARFFDLVVLGRSDRVVDRPHSDAVEETLLCSGRPVLLAPAKAPAAFGETIVVGWNGSAEGVRALAASLPLLGAARAVSIVTVGDREQEAATDVLEYLSRQGIIAAHYKVRPVAGAGPGQQLLAAAREQGADLLVMGGYGHSPWREILFGGATREIVGVSLLPLLLSH
jgi:nucleotide-binding universal stress UspA family protein